jgi:hypothetical protein
VKTGAAIPSEKSRASGASGAPAVIADAVPRMTPRLVVVYAAS